jgi:hypothetical protein
VSNFLSGYKYPTKVMSREIIGSKDGIGISSRRKLVDVSTTRIINNIAWGILRKRGRWGKKRKPWYNRLKGSSIYALYAKLVDGVIENSLKEAKQKYLE